MARFIARYFDGRSAAMHDVEVRVEGAYALIIGDGVLVTMPVAQMRFRPRLGRLPVSIELPDGALLQAEAAAVAAVLELPPAAANPA